MRTVLLSTKHEIFLWTLPYDSWTQVPRQDLGLLPLLSKAKLIQVTVMANGKKRARRLRPR